MSTLKNYLKEKFSGAEVSENKEGSNESFTITGIAVDQIKTAAVEFYTSNGYSVCDTRNRPIVYDGFSIPLFKERETITVSASVFLNSLKVSTIKT